MQKLIWGHLELTVLSVYGAEFAPTNESKEYFAVLSSKDSHLSLSNYEKMYISL